MALRVPQFEWDTADHVQGTVRRHFDSGAIKEHLSGLGLAEEDLQYGLGLQRAPRIINGVPEPPAPGQRCRLQDVTILAALNRIVASYKMAAEYNDAFWSYEGRRCGSEKTYQISAR